MITGNIARESQGGGIVVHESAKGRYCRNVVKSNRLAGVGVTDDADPIFTGNTISDGESGGVVLHGKCFGVFEKNRIVNNARANVGLKGGAKPLFDSNTISGGSGYGVWIQDSATGTFQVTFEHRESANACIYSLDADTPNQCSAEQSYRTERVCECGRVGQRMPPF